ncbi:MAG TPA: protease, partial [Bacteroidales bacterium]|nr:protease [Bacteroidales bacterium]
MSKLSNKKVAILLTDGFEEIEFTEPKKALEEAGAEVSVIAPDSGKV